MAEKFQKTLDYIRRISESETQKGRIFERLMKTYLTQDPIYKDRFSDVKLWSEWTKNQPNYDGTDIGIDLVAKERHTTGYCAIQSKCYADSTRISKGDIDSFISASAREEFTSRLIVDTGSSWGDNAKRTISRLKPACSVLRYGDLADRPINWPDLVDGKPEKLTFQNQPFSPLPHQINAIDDVISGFESQNRGKLIMACGTGKTLTSLFIAERVAGLGRRVLYLVPSISLFQQSMREWATHRGIPHRYVGICSDTKAGQSSEDASLEELEIPVTTDSTSIEQVLSVENPSTMTVVFCTYHSLGLIAEAQDANVSSFDLVICDEAHRTTGVERPGDKTSPFVLVHNNERIRANKRLYMTATPRLYTEMAKTKAASHDVEVYSMDDRETYGDEFHRLPFSQAIEQNLLSDYKVVVLGVREDYVDATLQRVLAKVGDGEINLPDVAQIIGCWRALQDPENKSGETGAGTPLRRAIAFANIIKTSKRLAQYWPTIVNELIEQLPETEREFALRCEVEHIDGQHHALDRKSRIDWLKGQTKGACRILSNARCLSEGVDVPALDAVFFITPRRSQVEIVQAVGRVMRKSEGKAYGYIILPIAIPAGADSATVLDNNERFGVVWDVLRALRSHDDRFNAEINHIDLNNEPSDRIIIFDDNGQAGNGLGDEKNPVQLTLPGFGNLPIGAIYAKIVEKCGDRRYWETWAKDVADIFGRLVLRINRLLENPNNGSLAEWFAAFHDELKISINESITRQDAVYMMAQHLLTQPVFDALFDGYEFSKGNPVARALDSLNEDFAEFGLGNETRDLEGFYTSVRLRARGLDNSDARQTVLMELYEKFFAIAMKKDASRLGIVYTPKEVVDFMLTSVDEILKKEFGRSLSDEGVNVLDPFTGTGMFLVRLLSSGLIKETDLLRKFGAELHANEIVLLAYYIAAVHIEEAFHSRRSQDDADQDYHPFKGIVLTDTFNLHTDRTGFPKNWLPDNSERVERQQQLPIQVIVGNPPWSVGQRSSADDNPNLDYPEMEQRISETYAAASTATLKGSLYDSYKMAIRWASDRVGEQGLIAFVTNGSWIDGKADSGIRACFAREFSSIIVVNLRGNQRTQGERSKMEGGKIFGQGSRAPVAITFLIRNPNRKNLNCEILYHDIGNYVKREEKLSMLEKARSIAGIERWETITPDEHHDWMNKRDAEFQKLFAIGTKDAKAGRSSDAVFRLYSRGYATSRDAYTYNFSREACRVNARAMVTEYMNAVKAYKREHSNGVDTDNIATRFSQNLRWDRELKLNMKRGKTSMFSESRIWQTMHRPFVKQNCYIDYVLVNNKYQMDRIFPAKGTRNRAICVPGTGSKKPFSTLMVDSMPDLGILEATQCFPRYVYDTQKNKQMDLLSRNSEHLGDYYTSVPPPSTIFQTTHLRNSEVTIETDL